MWNTAYNTCVLEIAMKWTFLIMNLYLQLNKIPVDELESQAQKAKEEMELFYNQTVNRNTTIYCKFFLMGHLQQVQFDFSTF